MIVFGLAQYLYRQREWMMEQIATQLGVSSSRPSATIFPVYQMLVNPVAPREVVPRASSRPKARTAPTPDVSQKMAEAVLNQGKTLEQVTSEFGMSSVQHAKLAVARERGRRETEPVVDRADRHAASARPT